MDKFRVFEDLWLKGFMLTKGGLFGSDFILYEGDVADVHGKSLIFV